MVGSSFFGVLFATVGPGAGSVSRGDKWAPAGLLAACPSPWATPQGDLGLAGVLVGEAALV